LAKQRLSEDVQQQLRSSVTAPAHTAPAQRRRPLPQPGDRLRRAVDTVLVELAADGSPDVPALHRLDDLLVGGLAWAAATGDTCRIEHAVHAVRDARARLDAADPDGARTALLTARADLAPPVARR
jgi:hypothetical protein